MNTGYHDPRYFISHSNAGPHWEIGDRVNGCDQVAECLNKAKAVRVWRALIAADGRNDESLAALEVEALREVLADNERVIEELKLEQLRFDDRMQQVEQAMNALRNATLGFQRSRPDPADTPQPKRKRKAK